MIENTINGFFKGLMSFIVSLLNLILNPLYEVIRSLLPFAFSDFIDSVNSLINSFIGFVPFIADMTFLPAFVIHMMVNYLIFKYTARFAVWSIKLMVKWWNALKG